MLNKLLTSVGLLLSAGQDPIGNYQRPNLSDIVYTKSGPVRGLRNTTVWHSVPYVAFVGIPYAMPPLGRLRFKPPVPITPWRNVFDAVKVADACPQMDFFSKEYLGVEDCLYLNVFTREFGNGTQLKPVMVWIYGGAFFSGHSNPSFYGPDFFLEDDVVVVSFNYRLGILGFLSLDHPDAVGNAGLKDQLLVMKWVQDNIAAFGGDPDQVTVFGESAGAVSVGYHMISEKSEGLFKKVILQSGSPLCQWGYHTHAKAFENARNLAGRLGYKGLTTVGILNFLRQASAESMVKKAQQVDLGVLPFRPTMENPKFAKEDAFLTECPVEKYKSGNFSRVPILLGYNHDEALFFLNYYVGQPNHATTIGNFIDQQIDVDAITELILGSMGATIFNMMPDALLEVFVKLMTNILFIAPIDLTQTYFSEWNKGNPIFYYRLSYLSEYSVHSMEGETINGTAHMDDVGYLFNVLSLNAPTDHKHPFNVFRKKLVRLWTNFAKYGNPTPKNVTNDSAEFGVNWLDSTKTGVQLDINEVAVMKNRLIDGLTMAYKQGYATRLPGESGCRRTPL
ncbi:juvenile hormone esterase-like [Halictus rubicundus]|uniref:juvenile hormone esterase-like n=1 Tax=Halictus rubicundus TaxID=77578 RepID=UPI00403532CB